MPQNIKRATGRSLIVTAMLAVVFSLALPLTQTGFAPAAFAQGAIREIAVAGNRRVEPEAVRSYMRINVGEAYDAAKVNASLTYFDDDGWDIGVWGKNLTNEAVIAATAAAGIPGPATAYLSEPRTYGLRFGVEF